MAKKNEVKMNQSGATNGKNSSKSMSGRNFKFEDKFKTSTTSKSNSDCCSEVSKKSKVKSNSRKRMTEKNGTIWKTPFVSMVLRKRKIRWGSIVGSLVLCVCVIGLIISVAHIIHWEFDNRKIKKQIDDVNTVTKVKEVKDSENVEIIDQGEVEQASPYWDYIKMNLIDVDFSELKKTNSQTVGWIQVNGTNINYPFVQNMDNDYYLTHAFDQSYNEAGWVFMDYRNNISSFDKNTILYAHGRWDTTMFGSLKNILTSNWISNSNNYVVKLSTEYENTLWQVFSIYRIPTTSDYLQIHFGTDDSFVQFAEKLLARSDYNFNTAVKANDRILTLSTCYNDADKVVLHAKLIKREAK